MKLFQFENFTCKLGESAKENWSLLNAADNHHLFFHLSSFPSGYVILKYEKDISAVMLQTSAQICKNGTKYRNLKDLKIDYCRCDNIEKGEKLGVVHFKSNKKVKKIR